MIHSITQYWSKQWQYSGQKYVDAKLFGTKKVYKTTKCVSQTTSIAIAVASTLPPPPPPHCHSSLGPPLGSQLMPDLNVSPLKNELRGGVLLVMGCANAQRAANA